MSVCRQKVDCRENVVGLCTLVEIIDFSVICETIFRTFSIVSLCIAISVNSNDRKMFEKWEIKGRFSPRYNCVRFELYEMNEQ